MRGLELMTQAFYLITKQIINSNCIISGPCIPGDTAHEEGDIVKKKRQQIDKQIEFFKCRIYIDIINYREVSIEMNTHTHTHTVLHTSLTMGRIPL